MKHLIILVFALLPSLCLAQDGDGAAQTGHGAQGGGHGAAD